MIVNRRGDHRSERDSWNSLQLFNAYRIGVIALILGLYLLHALPLTEQHNSSQFLMVAQSALLINVILLPLTIFRALRFRRLVMLMIVIDITAFTLLMDATSGLYSGLGLLIIPSIAAGSLLLPGSLAPAFAALGTLALLLELSVNVLLRDKGLGEATYAAIYGITFFAVAIVAVKLARQARTSEILAHNRGQALETLADLNTHIVESMDTGIIVVNDVGRIRKMNAAARNILALSDDQQPKRLSHCARSLQQAYKNWKSTGKSTRAQLPTETDSNQLFEASFVQTSQHDYSDTLIYLYDTSERDQRLQELKLAALGRLTASIAHEIRNPLGAISHATQLLAESEVLNASDQRLTQIVKTNSERMNTMVESILNLSKKESASRETMHLQPWLKDITSEFRLRHDLTEQGLCLEFEEPLSTASVDPGQLHQVVWNLLQNAQKHAVPEKALSIRLRAGSSENHKTAWLDICDNGAGIDEQTRQHLFEPFFTTANSGTGLGLFIARELCNSNGGSLEYLHNEDGGSRFRITLPTAA